MSAWMRHLAIVLAFFCSGAAAGYFFAQHVPAGHAGMEKRSFGGSCAQYIDKAHSGWFTDQWDRRSLKLVPTDCGRRINPADTPHMFYEIAKTYGDPERFGSGPNPRDDWKNVKGLINQLTCHLRIARNKPEWNIEPYRPWVGDEATEQAECNPY